MKLNFRHEKLRTYAQRNLNFLSKGHRLSPKETEKFEKTIINYWDGVGELTDEDVGYINVTSYKTWERLPELLEHWELREWNEANGEILTVTTYFSFASAFRSYMLYVIEGGYYDLIAVDKEGKPKHIIAEFSNF